MVEGDDVGKLGEATIVKITDLPSTLGNPSTKSMAMSLQTELSMASG
jgi:hypothetical protein